MPETDGIFVFNFDELLIGSPEDKEPGTRSLHDFHLWWRKQSFVKEIGASMEASIFGGLVEYQAIVIYAGTGLAPLEHYLTLIDAYSRLKAAGMWPEAFDMRSAMERIEELIPPWNKRT